jgi:serine/threonine-protein kinase RsbT
MPAKRRKRGDGKGVAEREFAPSGEELRIPILSAEDILSARLKGRALAHRLGLTGSNQTIVATAISELARNILQYARRGEVLVGIVESNGRTGISVVARDDGPGIPNVDRALQIGFSTSGSLGMGLPGVRRLMDSFRIESRTGKGTTVMVRKWK